MKVALWLALSHLLHEGVSGFNPPQTVPHAGVWTRGALSQRRPLFAEKKSTNEESERPKVPVPPPTAPDLEALTDGFVDTRSDDYEPPRILVKDSKPKAQLSPEDTKLVVASGIGSAFIGLIVGALIIFEFPDLDIVMEPLVWPVATAILFATAGAVGGASDGQFGEILRGTVGKAASSVGAAISAVVSAAFNAVIQAAQDKVKETTEEIKAIPSKVATAAKEKVEDAVEEISQIPNKVKDAAIETAENVKQKTIEVAEEVVEEIKATPGRVVESSRKAVADAVDDTLDAVEKVVEEVTAIPKKAVESVEETVNNLVGTKKPSLPQPPKTPPPMAEGKPEKPKTPPPISDLPKPPVPKLEIPKIEAPAVPKLEIPKIEPPKIEVPKLELPKVSLPKFDAPNPVEQAPGKSVESKKKDATSEIMEIQMAVRKATEEARRERSKAAEQNESQAEKEAQVNRKKEEAKKADADRKEAAIKAAEAKRQRELDIAKKQAAAEEAKRKREQEIAKQNAEREAAAEAARAKVEALKKKQAEAAKQSLQSAAPRRTISLGDLFNLGKNEDEKGAPPKQATPTTSQAPPGVPTLSNWKQNDDGSITGTITGSSSFKQGETITTSPVAKGASSGSVVRTNSGSRYFLGKQGGFSFSIPTPKRDVAKVEIPKVDKPKPVKPSVDKSAERKAAQAVAEERRRAAEEAKAKQAALAEERRKAAEELKAKQAALAEERRKAEEERKAAQAAEEKKRRKAADELKAKQEAIAAERQKAAEERQAGQAAAEEKRRKAAEEKRAALAAAAKEREAAQAKAAEDLRKAAEAAKAKQSRSPSEKRPTISLANIVPTTPAAAPKAVKAPRGVPEIRAWRKRPDGGIAGRIYGSSSFADGDFVETSPISGGSIENGSVVSTASGSRYFLSAEPAVKKANIAAAVKDMEGAKPGATITLTRQRKAREAAAAMEAVKSGKPRATFSLFGLGFGAADEGLPKPEAPRPSRPIPPKQAPRGVPTMSRWKKNFDGSITGLISGSKTFSDGDRVTTSPIIGGKVARGEVVTTGSGSKYFLS